MTKKTRFILFSIFVVLYLVIAPLIVFYSLGYRFDFEKRKIISTGGLYLKFWPENAEVLADGKIKKKINPLSNEMLIQGLFPKKHTISVKKDGYTQWEKTLEVKEKEVTKVENITLIKEKIIFEKLKENIKDFYISSNGDLILSSDPSTSNLENNKKLIVGGKLTFKKEGGYIYLLNTETNEFDNFYQAKDIIFSPDKSRFLFFNDHEILFANTDNLTDKIFLIRFSEKINNCLWLNNNYLIFDVVGKIKISEIDNRDKINIVELPQQLYLQDGSMFELKNPKFIFNQIDKKLYILTENTLLVSEKLSP